jgi:hypothetical protein
MEQQEDAKRHEVAARSMTVLDLLRLWNDPARLREDHAIYLLLSLLIAGESYLGVDWVQGWYARNLRIYANLAAITEAPSERILVVYGTGHVTLLGQVLRDSGLFDVESPLDYLTP